MCPCTVFFIPSPCLREVLHAVHILSHGIQFDLFYDYLAVPWFNLLRRQEGIAAGAGLSCYAPLSFQEDKTVNCSLATLAQAMSSTKPTAASMVSKMIETIGPT